MSAVTHTTDSRPVLSGSVLLPRSRPAQSRGRAFFRQVFQYLVVAALAGGCYFAISHFFVQSVRVVGRSMVPTLQDSQCYLLNRWLYRVRPPQRSDIVVVRDPGDNGFSVKRIIAVPGDSIYLKDGGVYLNGSKLKEPYLAPGTPTFPEFKPQDQLILCGEDQYFLLGDNRANSVDSRRYGPVPRGNILGPIMR